MILYYLKIVALNRNAFQNFTVLHYFIKLNMWFDYYYLKYAPLCATENVVPLVTAAFAIVGALQVP